MTKTIKARRIDLEIVRDILARHREVKRAWVYGSRARGDAAQGADIDLAIEAPALTPAELAQLRFEIEDSPLILRSDLLRLDDLPGDSRLRRNIAQDARLIYEAPKS